MFADLVDIDRQINWMSQRKPILRELLPLLLPVSPGVHSIIIDDYLDIQAAIRANYLKFIQEEYEKTTKKMCPYPDIINPRQCYYLSHPNSPFTNPAKYTESFVIYDEEPGFIDRAIWIFHSIPSEPAGRLFESFYHVFSNSAFEQAVRRVFPDASFDHNWLADNTLLSRRAMNCQSLQVCMHCSQVTLDAVTWSTEWDIYQKRPGFKPLLLKPPLTRLGRLRARYNKWTEQRNDIHQQEAQFVVFWTTLLSLLVFHAVLFSPVDPASQRVGAGGALGCWMLLTFILLYETAKEWRWAGKCVRLMLFVTCIAIVSCAIKLALILRDLEANPHVIMEFNWIQQLKSLFN